MECYFKYTCKSRTKDSINLETFFEPFFINGLITCRKTFEEKLNQQAAFEIPAKLLGQLVKGESTFCTYVVEDVTSKEFANYMHNFQIFLKFFIETGSYIDSSDSMWKIILMIEKVDKSDSRKVIGEPGWDSYLSIHSTENLISIE